jgi:predicted dienelactone hydrolase
MFITFFGLPAPGHQYFCTMAPFYIGSKQLMVQDATHTVSFPVLVQYPTLTPSSPVAFGPYIMEVSPDAPMVEQTFPLVIVSHGNGGSHLLYRTISMYLVQHGYIVAMPEHYGNNRNNNTLENTTENLLLRPRHISLTIDYLLQHDFFSQQVEQEKIAVIGHSMGGYTALALAGGIPRTREGEVIPVSADERVKALVLLAPGAGWFYKGLDQVTIPILLYSAEHDPVTPRWNADVVLNGVPDKSDVTFREVKNGGHFSFLSPFPNQLKKPGFLPSTDPEGFDREKFHQELPPEILAFLNEKLRH